MGEFSHFDQHGNAVMVDVTKKKETTRTAIAQGKIKVNDEIFEKVKEGSMAKGDVLGTARIAGIMAAKKTFELIPMCHLLMLTKCKVDFEMLEETKEIKQVLKEIIYKKPQAHHFEEMPSNSKMYTIGG